jgi:cardiolipin synthase A/B
VTGWLPSAEVLAIACAALFVLCAVLVTFIWSVKRHRDPHIHVDCEAPIQDLVASLAGLTHGMEIGGNSVDILEDGAFFETLIEHIGAARRSVHFETFLWKEGKLGAKVTEALCAKAREGVTVRVLVDANGCKNMGDDACARLKAAGVRFARFHPWKLRNIGVMNERDHRKIVVLDGCTAFVGGHCVVDEWGGSGYGSKPYHDISVKLCGPAVHQVQSAFSENWVAVTGELFAGEDYFPKCEPCGDLRVHVARVKPEGSAPAVKILHHMAICTAKKRLWIQNPYFLPEPEAIEAMGKAVARGVDVRVMVPTKEASDMPMVQIAAHRNFSRLLAVGVRILEYPTTLLHQKTLVVDGLWSAVGSTNFDDRAFEINDEITLGIVGEPFARKLEAIFERDAKVCREVDAKQWERRGLAARVKEHFFYLWNEWL